MTDRCAEPRQDDLAAATAAMLALPQLCLYRACRRRQRCCRRHRRTRDPFCLTRLDAGGRKIFADLLADALTVCERMRYGFPWSVSRDPDHRERQDAAIEIAFIVLGTDQSLRPSLRRWRRRHKDTAPPPLPPGAALEAYRETQAFLAQTMTGKG